MLDIDNLLYIMYTVYIMNNTLSATEARNNFFEILNLAIYKGEEFIVEKDGKPAVKISPVTPAKTSPEEITKIIKEVKKVFAKSARRKYWSVIDTPAWKKKERRYLERLSKGIID